MERTVAQICNLPYRRFAIGTVSNAFNLLSISDVSQNTILRYSRVQI